MQRVVITGIGALCALGNDRAQFAQALKDGKSGSAPITKFKMGW